MIDARGGWATATVDVYIDNYVIAKGVDCSYTTGGTGGRVEIKAYSAGGQQQLVF